jgi:hypothetical protein
MIKEMKENVFDVLAANIMGPSDSLALLCNVEKELEHQASV